MIFFPFIYEDELLYSICARYHRVTGNENYKTTMYELFASNNASATVLFPARLKHLSKQLPIPNAYTSDYFITRHTFFPYYAPFITEDRYQELKEIMSNEDGKVLYMKVGKAASSIKSPEKLKVCYECLKEDISNAGEVILRRTHQAEGVKICSQHHKWLIDSEIPYSVRKNKHELLSIEECISYEQLIRNEITDDLKVEHLKFIANQTFYLLNNNIKPLGLKNITEFYVDKLKQRGFVTVSGRVRWRELIPIFNKYYGEELLKDLSCFIDKSKDNTWLHRLLRKARENSHPLRHILMIGFLGETISSMVKEIDKKQCGPFGNGPWPCLNRAAEHFYKTVINISVITRDYKSGEPVGTFVCSCGFVYSRKGPDTKPNDMYKIGRIKEFGQVWENKLNQLAESDLSLRAKAEILGVDPKTVKNRLYSNRSRKIKSTTEVDRKKKDYRKQWIELLKGNSGKSITEIRSCNSKLYMWLLRNDKEWFQSNYPETKKIDSCKGRIRVDWIKRDQDILEESEDIVKEILSETSGLVRITKNEIERRLGKPSYIKNNLNKMPRVEKFLQENVESVEQFQVRRIKNIVKALKKTNSNIKEWEVIRAAGLKSKFVEKHKELIQREIQG